MNKEEKYQNKQRNKSRVKMGLVRSDLKVTEHNPSINFIINNVGTTTMKINNSQTTLDTFLLRFFLLVSDEE